LSSISHATRLGAGLPPGAVTSVEREALRRRLYGGDVSAPEVGGELHVVPEGQVGGVTEEVGLFAPDQTHNRPIGGDAKHLARLVAGDVQVARRIKGQPVRQRHWESGDLLARPCGAVLCYGDAEDDVAEGLGPVEVVAVR
jgi:hypothetical protein